MANPAFYYQPVAGGSWETVSLGEPLSDYWDEPLPDAEDAITTEGVPYRAWLGTRRRVHLTLERFGSPGKDALERDLVSMLAHLHRGGFVAFSVDHDKTWAALANSYPDRGDTSIPNAGNACTTWSTLGTLLVGDEVATESANPEGLYEVGVCDTPVFNPIVNVPLVQAHRYTFTTTTMVRWRWFWPWLWMPKDAFRFPIPADHRRTYTMDLTLEYSLASAIALFQDGF